VHMCVCLCARVGLGGGDVCVFVGFAPKCLHVLYACCVRPSRWR
jgi:hypothetical protein